MIDQRLRDSVTSVAAVMECCCCSREEGVVAIDQCLFDFRTTRLSLLCRKVYLMGLL